MQNLQNLHNSISLWTSNWIMSSDAFALQFSSGGSINPADNANAVIWQWIAGNTLLATDARIYIQKKCKLKRCFIFTRWNMSSSELSTFQIVVNGITSYTVTNTYSTTASNSSASNMNMDILLNKWDYISLKRVTPTRATNPTSVNVVWVVRLEPIQKTQRWEYMLQRWTHSSLTPVASTEYHLYDIANVSWASWWLNARVYVPKGWTIVSAYIYTRTSTVWTSELFTYSLRKNDITDYVITSSAKLDWISNTFTNNAMSVPVSDGDFLTLKKVTPARVTAPTSIIERIILVIQS